VLDKNARQEPINVPFQKLNKRDVSDSQSSGVAKEGQVGARAAGLRAHQHTFCRHLKHALSRNLDQSTYA